MYVNLCNVVRNASVLFSVVPLSHNCGTKITLISINKAKSYQHLQMLKSVSVNDLAIDVFGCFRVLFSDAEIPKDIPQHLIARNLSHDASQMIDRLADILCSQIRRQAGVETFAHAPKRSAGV